MVGPMSISVKRVDLLDDSIWQGVSPEAEAAFLDAGSEMIKSTLTLAHGLDLRATTVMGIFGAVGVALLSAAATLLTSSNPYWPLVASGGVTALGLFIAAAFCAAAIWPQEFYISGYEPRSLLHSSAADNEHRTRVLIAVTQDRIDQNRKSLAKAARFFEIALIGAAASVFIGVVVFGLLWGAVYRHVGMVHLPASEVVRLEPAAALAAVSVVEVADRDTAAHLALVRS